jgi:hypothetical protein
MTYFDCGYFFVDAGGEWRFIPPPKHNMPKLEKPDMLESPPKRQIYRSIDDAWEGPKER